MKRITNEQREAIVRKAIAERDAMLGKPDCAAGSPCSDCPDKRQCERGCIRQQEFISAEHHAKTGGAALREQPICAKPDLMPCDCVGVCKRA